MTTRPIQTDVCVIGAGSAGLSYAAGAAQMGARVVLVEADKMGGDCLNRGCVPSKALLAAAKAAVAGRDTCVFGVSHAPPQIDYGRVMDHVQSVIAQIAPHDSIERFEALGCTVLQGRARFLGARTVEVNQRQVRAKRFVIATGSKPSIPPIPGLESTPHMTSDTLWNQRTLPKALLIVGGGPVGLEMALAHQRLGAQVTVIEAETVLPQDDPDMVAVAREVLHGEGVRLVEGARITQAAGAHGAVRLTYDTEGHAQSIEGTDLLLATGRTPNIKGLDLRAAKVTYDRTGIETDSCGRTRNPRIFAIGDVAAALKFTHFAGHQAAIAIQNTLLPSIPFRRAVFRVEATPWVTYLDPELAQVGFNETTARAEGLDFRVERIGFDQVDRCVTDGKTKGFIKVLVDARNRVIGAGIVGAQAGELIHHWSLAVYRRDRLLSLAGYMVPYPTNSEINKKVVSKFLSPRIFSPLVRRLVRFWLRFL